MVPDSVAAATADAAVAGAAAAPGKRRSRIERPCFVDETSLLAPDTQGRGGRGSSSRASDAAPQEGGNGAAGNIQEEWRHIRFLSGHWSPWTVTILALHGQRLPTAALKELHHCSNLLLLHLEGCGLTSAEFFGDLWSLQRLLLPHNELQTLRGLKNLPHLEELCVKANPIATFRVGSCLKAGAKAGARMLSRVLLAV
ncbi:uncharacterized protein LOC113146916 [Cyclospora cayetanensis]|uniref:Uncharacterized protein LOC113146916 n=1 Tax=Cyclospora cayetanensis TaxID=88456 RepID=A0A6P6RVG2_9EIME|nr:uncharacterized protein LOC113146916 [Cyclospora cayetanensis]